MRNAFAEELCELANENKNIMLLSGDIGNKLFDDYKQRYPGRFMNCGVAEQNMIGVAAGMAMTGLRPITYTIAQFITTRCFEQIKLDACYQNLPIIIVGVGSGLSYATLGATHHACEDIGILRTLPNMKIICPGDANETRAALREALKENCPVYIRLGKKGEPQIHDKIPDLRIGKALTIKEGNNVCILSTGTMLPTAIQIGEQIPNTEVMSFHTIKPLDEEYLVKAFDKFKIIVTLEEHSTIGGLGSAIAEWKADNDGQATLIRAALADMFMPIAGDQDYSRRYLGLDIEDILKTIRSEL